MCCDYGDVPFIPMAPSSLVGYSAPSQQPRRPLGRSQPHKSPASRHLRFSDEPTTLQQTASYISASTRRSSAHAKVLCLPRAQRAVIRSCIHRILLAAPPVQMHSLTVFALYGYYGSMLVDMRKGEGAEGGTELRGRALRGQRPLAPSSSFEDPTALASELKTPRCRPSTEGPGWYCTSPDLGG